MNLASQIYPRVRHAAKEPLERWCSISNWKIECTRSVHKVRLFGTNAPVRGSSYEPRWVDVRFAPIAVMSRTARSSPEGLGAQRHLAAIIDRLPQLPSPLSVKRLQKKADSISVLVDAVARCRAAGPRTLVRI